MELVKQGKAPRPSRRSFSRSIYDAIASNAGPSTLEEIIQLLPATDDADKWQTATPDRVTQLLKTAESHGYVQYEEASRRWRVASKQWYDKQQQHIKDLRAAEKPDKDDLPKLGPLMPAQPGAGQITFRFKVLVWAFAGGWVAGVMSALAYVGLQSIA